jgi:phosphoribosylformylglycinamidine cyclo-ligase
MYKENEYDIAGFSVGIVEKSNIITGENIIAGDVLIGLSSSGVHSNGFSLIRKIIADANLNLDEVYDGLGKTLGEELLTPTKIYVEPILNLLYGEKAKPFDQSQPLTLPIKGMANITGGGFYENIPRILPKGLGAKINKGSWNIPPIFDLLQERGNLPEDEMYNIFNMGIGMALVVAKENSELIIDSLKEMNCDASIIGVVTEGDGIKM